MKQTILPVALLLLLVAFSCQEGVQDDSKKENLSGAGQSLDFWFASRSYPNEHISTEKFQTAFEQKKIEQLIKSGPGTDEWEAIGPKNIGGRTLRIGFNHQNANTIYAGTASGGLWRSYTGGLGINAWHRVATGFPVLGVPAIAVSPADSNIIYIGTGEVYNSTVSAPGIADRITRGSYGIGLLKSVDAGLTWEKKLDWEYADMRGILDIRLNPQNENTLFAATTEGLYRSYNAGESWELVHNLPMAVDVHINPQDTNLVFVTHGSYLEPTSGTFKSSNAGDNFAPMTLPSGYGGKTLLAISPSSPNVMFASVADEFSQIGLYQSIDSGTSWSLVNDEDVARWQGWYSHDVVVDPTDASTLIHVGIEVWKSVDAGTNLLKKTTWSSWYFGLVPVGGPEGPDWYVHADIHEAVFHPTLPNTVYFATDGGVFVSYDNGETFEGLNGGFQSTQFYANFANSSTDSTFAIGGMQDNSTAIYTGGDAWTRVIGGDGMSAAMNQDDDDILYGSYQNLGMLRSDNRGENFFNVAPPGASSETKNFAGPYELAPSNQNIVYAGAERLYKSVNGGNSWNATSPGLVDAGNPILTIAISPTNSNFLYIGTSDIGGLPPKVFMSINGGNSFTWITDLPERYVLDFDFHPTNDNIAYVVFGGFNVDHVWKTINGGVTWEPISATLPDVPTSTVVVDPEIPDNVYIGNDLGVYLSQDAGLTWELYSDGLPDATMVMHLSISPSNRKLRVATHGLGVWQSPLAGEFLPTGIEPVFSNDLTVRTFPNPFTDELNFEFSIKKGADVQIDIFNASGQRVLSSEDKRFDAGRVTIRLELSELPTGPYYYSIRLDDKIVPTKTSRLLIKS